MIADASTLLLLHGDGADQSTTISDEAGNTVTANGNAQIDTAQYKFASIGSSIKLDGDGDYLSVADATKWTFSGDFTIETWVRFTALPANGQAMTFWYHATDANNYYDFILYNNSGTYRWQFTQTVAATPDYIIAVESPGLLVDTWYHVALVRSGNSWKVFQGGIQCGATATSATVLSNWTGTPSIGSPYNINGWLAEDRISKVARYTSAFTPQPSPFSYYHVSIDAPYRSFNIAAPTRTFSINAPYRSFNMEGV